MCRSCAWVSEFFRFPGFLFLFLCCALPPGARAGGSALNTVVIVNQNSTNSCELGNYYCERRQVPPDNLLRINWPGSNISWTSNDFQVVLLQPLLDMLAARQLTNQVDYVVLSMDIPYQTSSGSSINGTTSALFYGLKPGGGTDWKGVTNSYAASEGVFRQSPPASAPGFPFLTTMLTAGSLAQAKQIVDQGVAGDGVFPTQPVILVKTSDPLRNLRYGAFDNAIFNARLRGNLSMSRTNTDSAWGWTGVLGCQIGSPYVNLSPSSFNPGSIADDLTSYD